MKLIKMPLICYILDSLSYAFGGAMGYTFYNEQYSDSTIAAITGIILQVISGIINRKQ